MFGCWFGRPADNYHRSVDASFDGKVLRIVFDEDGVLEIWEPSGIEVRHESTLVIPKAQKVRWTWFHYGNPKTDENKHFREYELKDGRIRVSSDDPLFYGKPDVNAPAVQL